MFSLRSPHTRINLFRVVEKDPPKFMKGGNNNHRHRRQPQSTVRASSSSNHHQQRNTNNHGSRNNKNDQEDFAQSRFDKKDWKNYGNLSSSSPTQSSSPSSQTKSFFLSRTESLMEQKADQLKKTKQQSTTTITPSPRQFQELSQVSFDPLDRARTKSERREALKKMKRVAMEEKQQEREDDMNISHVSVAEGKSTNPVLKEMNDFNNRGNQTAIASESALAQSTIFRNTLPSRRNMSSWDLIGGGRGGNQHRHKQEYDDLYGSKSARKSSSSIDEDVAQRSSSRAWEKSEGHYKHTFDESTNLEHHRDALQHSRSVYTQRELPIPGLYAYHNFITPLEEKQVAGELTKLLLKPVAAFHATEGRYCVNLLDKKINLKVDNTSSLLSTNSNNREEQNPEEEETTAAKNDNNTLAFSIHEDSPTLKSVFQRASRLGLIPSMPNVVQVSEMVTPYSGYPPHLKHTSIGSYCGVLNLISRAQMSFVHLDQPWAPKVLMVPRSMYVMSEDLMKQFRVGYSMMDHELKYHQTSQEVARFTKDYRLEVMFATVDVEEVPRLAVPVKASEKLEEMLLLSKKKN